MVHNYHEWMYVLNTIVRYCQIFQMQYTEMAVYLNAAAIMHCICEYLGPLKFKLTNQPRSGQPQAMLLAHTCSLALQVIIDMSRHERSTQNHRWCVYSLIRSSAYSTARRLHCDAHSVSPIIHRHTQWTPVICTSLLMVCLNAL